MSLSDAELDAKLETLNRRQLDQGQQRLIPPVSRDRYHPEPSLEFEQWLTVRLLRSLLFTGITTADERRELLRRHLLDHDLELAIAGRAEGGKAETWAELFERAYGQPLLRPMP